MSTGYRFGAMNQADPQGLLLSMAAFNEHAGLRRVKVFTRHTSDGEHQFSLLARGA